MGGENVGYMKKSVRLTKEDIQGTSGLLMEVLAKPGWAGFR
ncbi:MAG: hypothetical protein V3U17_05120 [Thermoplasmata archaeon]